jgi:hypothetical protein
MEMNVTRSLFALCLLTCCSITFAQSPLELRALSFDWVNSTARGDTLLQYVEKFDEAGEKISKTVFTYPKEGYKHLKVYNASEQLVREEKRGSSDTLLMEKRYFYDEEGYLSKVVRQQEGKRHVQKVQQLFTPEGLLMKTILSDVDDPTQSISLLYSYNQENQKIRCKTLEGRKEVKRESYEYNSQGQCTEETIVFLGKNREVRKTYKFKKGNLVKEEVYENGELVQTTEHERDKSGKLLYSLTTYPDREEESMQIYIKISKNGRTELSNARG